MLTWRHRLGLLGVTAGCAVALLSPPMAQAAGGDAAPDTRAPASASASVSASAASTAGFVSNEWMNASNTMSVSGNGGSRYQLERTLPLRGDDSALTALSDGTAVYVLGLQAPGYNASVITAFRLSDGRRLWGPLDLGWTRARGFLAPGALYVSAPDGDGLDDVDNSVIMRLDTTTGRARWRIRQTVYEAPVLVGDVLHAGPLSLDAATGRLLRTTLFEGTIQYYDYAAEGGWLYHAGGLAARRLASSTMRTDWQVSSSAYREDDLRPMLAGGRFYVRSNDSGPVSYALDAQTGRRLLRLPTPRAVTPTATADVTWRDLIEHTGTRITVRDGATGERRWRRYLRTDTHCDCSEQLRAPLIVGNTMFLALRGGASPGPAQRLLALDMRSGQQLWQRDMSQECQLSGELSWTGGRLLVPTGCDVQVYRRAE